MKGSTIYVINGREYTDQAEVTRLVAAGAIAEEISPEDQAAEQECQAQLEADQERQRNAIEAYRARQAFEATAEGQREIALREGSRVTLCGDSKDPFPF